METPISLLFRVQHGADPAAWQRLHDLYAPFIRDLLRRDPALREDADDLVQDVMTAVVGHVAEFDRRRFGAFRAWLRTVVQNRIRQWWRDRRGKPRAEGGSEASLVLSQLEDPESALSRRWDQQHDNYVLRHLLDQIEPDFEPSTVRAFRMVTLEGNSTALAASILGISEGAVLTAKSRVLARLRQEAEGLID